MTARVPGLPSCARQQYRCDHEFVGPGPADYYPEGQHITATAFYRDQIARVPLLPKQFGYNALIKHQGSTFGKRTDNEREQREKEKLPAMNEYNIQGKFGQGGRKESLGTKPRYSGVHIPSWF